MSEHTCACAFQDASYLGGVCGAGMALFMGMLDMMLRKNCGLADACRRTGKEGDALHLHEKRFDFVVVGAGVAGAVVGARLSETPQWRVLVLEAGPEEPTVSQVPAFAVAAVGTHLDWNYTTVRQRSACLNSGGVCHWPRGKMVAGTGAMSGMMYTRGHRAIYDYWATLGNSGWSYDHVLPYFLKAESYGDADGDTGYHGYHGLVNVNNFLYRPPLADDLVKAGIELGYRRGDLNGANQTGVNIATMMVHRGLRASTARMYLRPAVNRSNLVVATKSHVTKILIDRHKRRAYGVTFVDKNGVFNTVYAEKEVILCAGAIGSPQLLLLSGIGPTEHLEELNISVVIDLPVGRNLRNHVSVGVGFHVDEPNTPILTMPVVQEFLQKRTGPLASTGLTQFTGFFRSKYSNNDVPDLQIFFDGYSAKCPRKCGSSTGVVCGRRYVYARPTNVLPLSVGYLKLKSADPFEYPIIDPKYLAHPRDAQILVEGLKTVVRLSRTAALARWNFQIDKTAVAGCTDVEFASDQYWACVVRRATGPENHPGGTVRMGPDWDPDAVVSPQLRVHGISNLRVVDASVFPYMPNANPIAAIIMAAEKLADMVDKSWRRR